MNTAWIYNEIKCLEHELNNFYHKDNEPDTGNPSDVNWMEGRYKRIYSLKQYKILLNYIDIILVEEAKAQCQWIITPIEKQWKKYYFAYTTNRWRINNKAKWYHSKSLEDFLERFIING